MATTGKENGRLYHHVTSVPRADAMETTDGVSYLDAGNILDFKGGIVRRIPVVQHFDRAHGTGKSPYDKIDLATATFPTRGFYPIEFDADGKAKVFTNLSPRDYLALQGALEGTQHGSSGEGESPQDFATRLREYTPRFFSRPGEGGQLPGIKTFPEIPALLDGSTPGNTDKSKECPESFSLTTGAGDVFREPGFNFSLRPTAEQRREIRRRAGELHDPINLASVGAASLMSFPTRGSNDRIVAKLEMILAQELKPVADTDEQVGIWVPAGGPETPNQG